MTKQTVELLTVLLEKDIRNTGDNLSRAERQLGLWHGDRNRPFAGDTIGMYIDRLTIRKGRATQALQEVRAAR